MPASAFATTNFQKGFSGSVLYTLDDGTGTSVYGFPAASFTHASNDNNDYPSMIDNNGVLVNKVRGMKTGPFSQSGAFRVDRGMAPFLSTGFGPRAGGKLPPWITTVAEYSGATPYAAAGIWFQRFLISGAFGINGRDAQIRYQLDGMCLDPNNSRGAAASLPATAAGGAGTQGNGISTFANVVFDNGAANPTVYDGIQMFQVSGDNQTTVDPAVGDPVNGIIAGMTPAQFIGGLTLTQLKGAVNPVPQVNGEYPLRIKIPTGDGLHVHTILLTGSYNSDQQPLQPNDYNKSMIAYRTLGYAPGSATSPMTHTYA